MALDLSTAQKLIAQRLTSADQQLFDHFRFFTTECKATFVMRVAGGWVRDKLLNRNSSDIDITLDSVTAGQFIDLYNRWLNYKGKKQSEYAILPVNRNKCKHLQVIKVGGLEGMYLFAGAYKRNQERLNLGSLKTVCRRGTIIVVADARGRDFTINALFYNLETRQVEDFTGRGVADLYAKRLVTPKDAVETFKDDPLRLLRGVRFSVNLGFHLDRSIVDAAHDPNVREGLRTKITQGRLRNEFDKLRRSEGCNKGIQLINEELDIGGIILEVDPSVNSSRQQK